MAIVPTTEPVALRMLQEHVAHARSWHAKNGTGPRPKRFNGSWDWITRIAAAVVTNRLRDNGIQSSLRYVFYRLVTMDILQNSLSEYTALASETAQARRDGWFPRLVDHNREIYRPATYGSLSEQLQAETKRMIDRDQGQPRAIFVAVEKQTVAESVKHWLRPYGIPIIVLRGYASQTLVDEVGDDASAEADLEVAEVAADVLDVARTEGRPLVLMTIGDFDASGDHLMELFVERTDCWDEVVKIGVTFAQAGGLPLAPAKKTDTRIEGFCRRYWPDEHARLVRDMRDRTPQQRAAKFAEVACQVEVEALEAAATDDDPEPLRTLLMAAIEPYWDPMVAEMQIARERGNQALLRRLARLSEDQIERMLNEAAS